ncbi:MAG: hypothetical protein AAB706_04390 [Patescibacteria group bacterium]
MAEEKVYHTEVIEDAPFPGQDIPVAITQAQPPVGTFTPTATKEKTFPKKRTAVELISTALNTRSKKILKEFEFADSGAIQVGKYENGVSGDLRITPDGLTARNQSGLTTFAIDGDTGDAIFLGRILAGSIIAEGELVGGSIDIGGDDATSFHVDEDGNMWLGADAYASAPFKVSSAGALVATSVTISGYVATGGSLADIGAGNITSTYIGDLQITTGKLAANAVTAAKITAGTITATEIASNAITAVKIAAGVITADKMSVTDLSAISANIGTITAGTITGITITGGTIRTAASGARTEFKADIIGGIDGMISYNSSGTAVAYFTVDNDGNFSLEGGEVRCEGNLRVNNTISCESGNLILSGNINVTGDLNAATIRGASGSGDVRIRVGGAANAAGWFDDSDNSLTVQKFFIVTTEKTAIVPTSKGYNALYSIEAPEVWFMDFIESKREIDPMFLEVTEGEIKFVKLADGGYQVWRRRKGHAEKRFGVKTYGEFIANEKFLGMARPQ